MSNYSCKYVIFPCSFPLKFNVSFHKSVKRFKSRGILGKVAHLHYKMLQETLKSLSYAEALILNVFI